MVGFGLEEEKVIPISSLNLQHHQFDAEQPAKYQIQMSTINK